MKLWYTDLKRRSVFVPDDFPDDAETLEKGLQKETLFEVYTSPERAIKIGHFRFVTLPGNCGVVVSTDTYVEPAWRGFGGGALQEVKAHIAKELLGYSLMLSTVISTNVPEVVGASKAIWRFISDFVNKRTGNVCLVGVKHLK